MSFDLEQNAYIKSFLFNYKKSNNPKFAMDMAKKAMFKQAEENNLVIQECLDYLNRKGWLKQSKIETEETEEVEESDNFQIKVKVFNRGEIERQVLSFFIFNRKDNRKFVSQVSELFKNDFLSPEANRIANFCINYYKKHGILPEEKLSFEISNWKASDEQKDAVMRLLHQVRATKFSDSEMLSLAERHFTEVRAERLENKITKLREDKAIAQIQKEIINHQDFKVCRKEAISVLSDMNAYKNMRNHQVEPVIEFDGALGKFFSNHLCRDGFVSFLAPAKRGKSWWLQHCALQAVKSSKKVLFFSVGDLSEEQQLLRLVTAITKKPTFTQNIAYPEKIEFAEGLPVVSRYPSKLYKESSDEDWKFSSERLIKQSQLKEPFKLLTYSNSTCSIAEIENQIKSEINKGWIPDVVIIDYADILLIEGSDKGELREGTNNVWRGLRRLSQDYHCLVLTATQGNKDSYKTPLLGRDNFSDDRRKNDHVTGIIGINQSMPEKELGVYRLNWVVCREGNLPESTCVYTASCLELGNPAVCSCWKNMPEKIKTTKTEESE